MDETNNKESKQSRLKQTIIEYLKVIIITVVLTYGVLYFVQISRVVGSSMEPNYHNGNIVLVNKQFYSLSDVSYGDVVVVKYEVTKGENQIIKRVIGKPGDTISCKNHVVYRNGKKLDENYIKEQMTDSAWSYDVPKGSLFVMGDNRNNSLDSRYIGTINFKSRVVGKVFFKVF